MKELIPNVIRNLAQEVIDPVEARKRDLKSNREWIGTWPDERLTRAVRNTGKAKLEDIRLGQETLINRGGSILRALDIAYAATCLSTLAVASVTEMPFSVAIPVFGVVSSVYLLTRATLTQHIRHSGIYASVREEYFRRQTGTS